MKLTYIKQAGEPNGDAGDQYTGLDRFGRVVDQRWPQGTSELERVKYGFTPASNRQWRQETLASGQDQYYNYDGLYQVQAANQGTLNSGKTGIVGTPTRTEDFTYDPIGNWNNYLTKVSGVTDLDQDRTHNTANQTTEIDGSPATVAHDPVGNMTKVPQVTDWSSTNELKWDAWNRLVEVQDGSTPVAEYAYDGLTRRIKKTVGGTTRRYYYSTKWQILEERLNAATTAERQFVWGLRYTDDLVLRMRGSERLYMLSDYFNPTAIADEAGTVLERYGYDTFGLSRVMTPSFAPRTSSNYDWETRFHAYRYDAETGLYQVRYRYLHPTLGRWPSRDPIAERGGLNLYGFVDNNPVNWVDALGLKVYFVMYYDRKETDASGAFGRAATTWATDAKKKPGWNDKCDVVITKKFTKEEDFTAAWKEIDAAVKERKKNRPQDCPCKDEDYLIESGVVFSHATQSGLEFPNGTLGRQDIKELPKLDWAATGQLSLQGCNTASVNDNFCSSQGVTTLGQIGYAYFSESATKYVEIDKKGQGTSTTVYLNSYNRGRNSWFGNGNVVPPEVVKP